MIHQGVHRNCRTTSIVLIRVDYWSRFTPYYDNEEVLVWRNFSWDALSKSLIRVSDRTPHI